jgi:hypothetical protein
MANIVVPYLQGLWKSGYSPPLALNDKTKLLNRQRPPLRDRIPIQHPQVIDLSPDEFWRKHLPAVLTRSTGAAELATVALITGSLDRDRVDGYSCAL